jgi:hypothetical protein
MDYKNIQKLSSSLSKMIEDNEKITLPVFAAKLANASEAYPEDQTIGVMADVVSRMANSNKMFITRAEVKDLYKRLYSRNTKFASLFSDELGEIEKVASIKINDRSNDDENMLSSKSYEDSIVDRSLLNGLNSAFGTKSAGYSDDTAKKAKSACIRACACVKLASKIEVVNGDENVIICNASFETPKGLTTVLVPIEVKGAQVFMPNAFIANTGVEDLTKESLQKYIVSNAGKKLIVSADMVMQTVKNAKGNVSEVSGVDLALTKLNAEKETKTAYSDPGILGQKLEGRGQNLTVKTASYQDKEMDSFSKNFDTAVGIACFQFGKDKVAGVKKTIENMLTSFGCKGAQVSVCDADDKVATFAASMNAGTTAFKIPVNMTGKTASPSVLLCNGSLYSFSKSGVNEVMSVQSSDHKTAAVASPFYDLKGSELVEIVRVAASEKNYAKAEDALNVLASGGDAKAYKVAMQAYADGLNGKEVVATNTCKMVVKNATSQHPICGHTGLPLHKVYQDKNGDCHPNYRKAMEDSQDGAAYLMNSKIFF